MEEIESYYKEEIKQAELDFLKSLNENMPREKAELNYLKKVRSIRKEYKKRYEQYLKTEEKNIRKKDAKLKKEIFKTFKVEGINLNLTFFEKIKIRKATWFFKLKRKLRGTFYKTTPTFLIYSSIKIKKKLNLLNNYIRDCLERFVNRWKERTISLGLWIKKIWEKITEIISKNSKKLITLILKLRKKKEEKVEEKKEEK